MGITVPTPIQRLTVDPILKGRDVIAKAETGTGKTLAFGAPMMSLIDSDRSSVLALCLCPTRELALQVAEVLRKLGEPRKLRVALLVGGDPIHPQIAELKLGAQVVVGTPGRILDLHQQRFLTFPWTQFAVLDEADKMFEIGFLDDVKKILGFLPDERQTLLFSATYPREILGLGRDFTKDPVEVATAKGLSTTDTITQLYLETDEARRASVLERILADTQDSDILLIFCDRRTEVDRLLRRLERSRFPITALHGGYDQAARSLVMAGFRAGRFKALVATDVASRGLDVDKVTHVVNYSVPRELEDYTHRIGRTGRAGRTGTAITFVTPSERRRWDAMCRQSGWTIERFEFSRDRDRNQRGRDQESNPPSKRPEGRRDDRSSSNDSRGRDARRGDSRRAGSQRTEPQKDDTRQGGSQRRGPQKEDTRQGSSQRREPQKDDTRQGGSQRREPQRGGSRSGPQQSRSSNQDRDSAQSDDRTSSRGNGPGERGKHRSGSSSNRPKQSGGRHSSSPDNRGASSEGPSSSSSEKRETPAEGRSSFSSDNRRRSAWGRHVASPGNRDRSQEEQPDSSERSSETPERRRRSSDRRSNPPDRRSDSSDKKPNQSGDQSSSSGRGRSSEKRSSSSGGTSSRPPRRTSSEDSSSKPNSDEKNRPDSSSSPDSSKPKSSRPRRRPRRRGPRKDPQGEG